MLFIIMQQVQPASIMALMHSQQDWIMAAQCLSPEVQVTVTPSLVMSHLHMPMVRLQQQTIMPFIMQQQLHIEPARLAQRFCIMLQAVLSSQLHMIFMPPLTFSIFILQRGIIMKFIGIDAPGIGMPVAEGMAPGMVIGFIIVDIMRHSPRSPHRPTPPQRRSAGSLHSAYHAES
jgi:hypothetical protein